MGVSAGLRLQRGSLCGFLLLFLSLATLVMNARGQSCASNEVPSSVARLVATDKCQEAWGKWNYTLRFQQNTAANTLGVILSVPKDDRWFGMGFNSIENSMPGTRAIIFWQNPTTQAAEVNTYRLTSTIASDVDVDSSALTYATPPKISIPDSSDYIYLTYVVKQSPPSDFTYINFAVSNLGDVPAQDTIPSTQNEHEDMVTYNVNYQTGAVTVTKDNTNSLRRSHGILNIIGWGILLPLGVIIARYARGFDPAWFYTHAILQLLGYILIAAGFGLGLKIYKRERGADHLYAHKVIGIILFILATLQILLGVIRPKKDAKMRHFWNWGHWWLGRSAVVLAAVNIFVGIHAAGGGRKWKIGYGVILGLELLLLIPLEALYWLNYRKRSHEALPPNAGHKGDLESSALDSTVPPGTGAPGSDWGGAKY